MLNQILDDLKELKPKIIQEENLELYDLYEPLSNVEKNIKSISKNSKKSFISIEALKEEIELKNDQIFSLKNKIENKQLEEVKIYRKIINILDQIDSIYKFAEQTNNNQLINSLDIIKKIIRKEIEDISLEEIKSKEELFNPIIHKCISTIEDSTKQSKEIVEVLETGYKLNGNVLRPASVIIVR